MEAAGARRIVIVTPVLNDWQSLEKLITDLADLSALAGDEVNIVAVDDGSSFFEPPGPSALRGPIKRIQVLHLRANQGHQRAIALGLAYVRRDLDFDIVIVMDSDGEDRPEDLLDLLAEHQTAEQSIIAARRRRRSEGLFFVVFYQFYKFLFRRLTGKSISFGNFSLIPAARLDNVIFNPGIWNNFAATLLKCRIPIRFVPTVRGKRYYGSSTMNFSSLIVHGMSAISVFSDIVIGRIIIGLCLLSILFVVAVGVVLGGKFLAEYFQLTGYFIPGYTTNVILLLVNMLMNALFIGLLMILSLLATRSTAPALPSTMLEDLTSSIRDVAAADRIADAVT